MAAATRLKAITLPTVIAVGMPRDREEQRLSEVVRGLAEEPDLADCRSATANEETPMLLRKGRDTDPFKHVA
jgi:hypothetical protein